MICLNKLSMFKPAYLFIVFLVFLAQTDQVLSGCYTSIFSFGDSLADTGNLAYSEEETKRHVYDYLPYGETFFHHPTGRCSDGRLVIDFIAQALGISLVSPYLGHSKNDFVQGVNFAVAGATAIDTAFFEERGIQSMTTNYSLGVQLEWFKQLLPTLCDSPSNCNSMLRDSLFLVGEIGGNDYNYPFYQKRSVEEVRTIVPTIIDIISSTITALIAAGAVTLMVPGNLPIGCSSSYLTIFQSSHKDDYDPSTGCITWLNKFSQYHNQLLQNELNQLRELHPQANIIYADYYNVAMELFQYPTRSGFKQDVLMACCGGGGHYNYNLTAKCGFEGSNSCEDPLLYVNWDGVHMTEAAYKWITTGLLKGQFTTPPINILCKLDS